MLKVCDRRQFVEKVNKVDFVVCFGAGKYLKILENLCVNTIVCEKLKCIVDNDIEKQNSKIIVEKKEIEVFSIDELKKRKYENYVIIITCSAYREVLDQLNKDNYFQNIDTYCLTHILLLEKENTAMQKKVPSDFRLEKVQLIPKVIHYCWFGGGQVPDKYKYWMESWKKFCPDYEIIEWNEQNYDVTKNLYMRQAYENRKWGFVPDYARMDIIYRYGGIYLDTDVELVQGFDDLLYQRGFLGFECPDYVNLGQGFGAVKGLPIFKEMMSVYDNMDFINADGSLNMVASPYWQTKVLEQHGLKLNGEYQIVENLTVYPEKVLCGKSWSTRRVVLKPYTKSIHHFEGSWIQQEKRYKYLQLENEMRLAKCYE